MAEQQQPFHLIAGGEATAASDEATLRGEIAARDRQEAAIAELGQAALTAVEISVLLGQACALVESTLSVGHCRILERTAAQRMITRASIGTNETFLHCPHDDADNDAIGMVTMLSEDTLVFDTSSETRFPTHHLREHHQVTAGVGIAIRTQRAPFGALLIYASSGKRPTDYALGFLRAVGNIIGEAVARSRAETALRRSETRLRQFISSALDAVITVDANGTVVEWNPQAEVTFGLPGRQVLGQRLPDSLLPLDAAVTADISSDAFTIQDGGGRVESEARRASGNVFPVEVTYVPFGTGSDQTLTIFVRDISERRRVQQQLEHSERRFRTIVEKSWSGVILLDSKLRVSFVGSSIGHILGYGEEEVIGHDLLSLVHSRERKAARAVFDNLMVTPNEEAQGELRFKHKNGGWVWLEGFAQNLLEEPGLNAIVVNYRDIGQRKAAEKQIEYQAYYDPLTGLPNRLLFRDRVVHSIAQARRHRRTLAIIYIDLNEFKLVNDSLGHTVGDLLLVSVARRLQTVLRSSDTISRHSGDEFSLLVTDVDSSEAVGAIAHKLLTTLSEPIHVGQQDLVLGASIGISLYPNDGDDAETLLRCADTAMHRARELGRNQVHLFTPGLNERFVRRLHTEQSLHRAIARGELELYYQPIYDRSVRRVQSVEALLRWNDPQRGLVPPAEFIGLAEETGQILEIGEWVLRASTTALKEWQALGHDSLRMSVNISAHQLQQPNFVQGIADVIGSAGIPPALLQLEITETVAMQNIDRTMRTLREVHEMGVKIAVDDFGTGQSSLIYLRKFPIDMIKLDKEFLRDVTEEDTAAAIVNYVIGLAHSLQLDVVAEGVETEEQYSLLRHYGCDLMQGYLFTPPLPAGELLKFLKRGVTSPKTLEVRLPKRPGA